MERFVKGDVIVMPFPYSDFSGAKKRPAIVIATLKGDDVILSQITTVRRTDENLTNLSKKDFKTGHLNRDSFINMSQIFTADKSRINYKVGKVNNSKIKEIEQKLCEIFTR